MHPGHALLLLEAQQVGSDVVIRGRGSANSSALLSEETTTDFTNVLSDFQIYTGPAAFGDTNGAGADLSLWSSITGPSVFGADASVLANPDTGPPADPAPRHRLRYSPGRHLPLFNQNLSRHGFTPGPFFTWSWGNGGAAPRQVGG